MDYVRDIIFAAAVCGIFTYLSPEKRSGGLVRFAAAVAFLSVLATPLGSFAEGIEEMAEQFSSLTGADGEGPYTEAGESCDSIVAREICTALLPLAAEHFGVSEKSFAIRLIFGTNDSGEPFISRCEVEVEKGELQTGAVAEYFRDMLGCEVTVNER